MTRGIACLMALALTATTTSAHRLTLEWQRFDNTLAIHAHFDNTPATGADIEITDASGTRLALGVLDPNGRFQCPLSLTGAVTVVVNAGLGHRRTLKISESDLFPGHVMTSTTSPLTNARPTTSPTVGATGSSNKTFLPVLRVVLGLVSILALYAAWIGHHNSRRISALEQQSKSNAR